MASGFTVSTVFTARGNLSRELRTLHAQFGQLGVAASRAKSALIGIGTGAVVGGAAALAFGVREVGTEFINLDQAVTSAAARWGDAFDRGTDGFNSLMDAAKNVGLTTEHQATQAAEGLTFMAMAGFSAEESLALLPGIANLATAANLDFARSTDIASDAMGAFGMASGSAEEKANAFRKITEQTAKTVNLSNTTISQWFEAVSAGASTFRDAGQEMSTFNALVAGLAGSSIKGEKAGTAIRGIIANFSKPAAREELKRLGIKITDNKGRFLDFLDVVAQFEKKLPAVGTKARTTSLFKMFGKQQMSQMSILIDTGSEKLRQFRDEIENSAGADVQLASKMRKSIQNSVKLVQSALIGKGINIIQELFGGDDPAEALTNMANAIQDFDTGPLVEGLRETGRMLRDIGKWLFDNKEMFAGMAKAFLAIKAGSLAMDLANGTAALATFGRETERVSRGASKNFRSMGNSLRTALGLIQALIVAYESLKFAADAVAENQEKRLENKRKDAALDRAFKRADISQFKTKNLQRLKKLDEEELKRQENKGWLFGSGDKQREKLRERISAFDAELAARRDERARQKAQRSAAFDWEEGVTAGVTRNRLTAPTAPVQTTRSETRTESVSRFEVDWGVPPEGVTVNELPTGGMP